MSEEKSKWEKFKEVDEGFNFKYIALIYKTKKLNNLIDLISNKLKRFWKAYFTLGIPASFLAMAQIFYTMFNSVNQSIGSDPSVGSGASVQVVIPGITIPLVAGLVAIMIVMIVHEISHGIATRISGIPIKSTGVFLAAVLPGAYVTPDEEVIYEHSLSDRLRIYGAGSYSNIVLGLLLLSFFKLFPNIVISSPLAMIFKWSVYLNIGVGAINLMPIYPLDGGRMIKDTLDRFAPNKKLSNSITGSLSIIGFVLILLGVIL